MSADRETERQSENRINEVNILCQTKNKESLSSATFDKMYFCLIKNGLNVFMFLHINMHIPYRYCKYACTCLLHLRHTVDTLLGTGPHFFSSYYIVFYFKLIVLVAYFNG